MDAEDGPTYDTLSPGDMSEVPPIPIRSAQPTPEPLAEAADQHLSATYREDDPEEPIFSLAWDCDDLLRGCLKGSDGDISPLARDRIEEYDQRFRAWQEYLGVFADKRANLDYRLRKQPEIRDLIVRLLLILRRNLDQLIEPAEDDKPTSPNAEEETSAFIEYCCRTIDEALTELNQIAVAIRKASTTTETTRARIHASEHSDTIDLDGFETLCILALEILYSDAPESLILQLGQSMADRYARLALRKSRHENLKMDVRRPHPEIPNIATPYFSVSSSDPTPSLPVAPTATAAPSLNPVERRDQPPPTVTSADPSLFQMHLKAIQIPKSRPGTTVIMAETHEPRILLFQGTSDRRCQWCFNDIGLGLVKDGRWTAFGREHYSADLEPFCCISEDCAGKGRVYSSLKKWKGHMAKHNRNWAQSIHQQEMWACRVGSIKNEGAEGGDGNTLQDDTHEPGTEVLFTSTKELQGHLGMIHREFWESLGPMDITRIIDEAAFDTSQNPDICPLCRMRPESLRDSSNTSHYAFSIPAEMENHIAGHLQKIMVLSLRLIDIQTEALSDDEEGTSATPTENYTDSLGKYSESNQISLSSDGSQGLQFGTPTKDHSLDNSLDDHELDYSKSQEWSNITDYLAKHRDGSRGRDAADTYEKPTADDFTICWICDDSHEVTWVFSVLDKLYLEDSRDVPDDHWHLDFGRIGVHNIVIAHPIPASGACLVAAVEDFAVRLRISFPGLRLWLIIGSGISPSPSHKVADQFDMDTYDVRLGDVVVAALGSLDRDQTAQGLVSIEEGSLETTISGLIGAPEWGLRNVIANQKDRYKAYEAAISDILKNAEKSRYNSNRKVRHSGPDQRVPPKSEQIPAGGDAVDHFASCSLSKEVDRPNRAFSHPFIHYGGIKIFETRTVNEYYQGAPDGQENILAVCPALNHSQLKINIPLIMIRGICGYDNNVDRNTESRSFAMVRAAAYTKLLLQNIHTVDFSEYLWQSLYDIKLMGSSLKMNSCNIGSSETPLSSIDHRMIRRVIPSDLQAACHSWVYILEKLYTKTFLFPALLEIRLFIDHWTLPWIEVVLLLGSLALEMIQALRLIFAEAKEDVPPILSHVEEVLKTYGKSLTEHPLRLYRLCYFHWKSSNPSSEKESLRRKYRRFGEIKSGSLSAAPIPKMHPGTVAEVLQYLNPSEIIRAITTIKDFRSGLMYWNSTKFDGEQLLNLYSWNEAAIRVAEQGGAVLPTPDIRRQIISHLQCRIKDINDRTIYPLPLDSFTIFCYGVQHAQSQKAPMDLFVDPSATIQFIDDFHKTTRSIYRFFRKISEIQQQFHGLGLPEGSNIEFNSGPFCCKLHISCLLLQVLIDTEVNTMGLTEFYKDGKSAVSTIIDTFGHEAGRLLGALITSGLVADYVNQVSRCDSSFLPQIYSRLVRPRGIPAGTYATYILFSGFDRALGFLEESSEVIEFLEGVPNETLKNWGVKWARYCAELADEQRMYKELETRQLVQPVDSMLQEDHPIVWKDWRKGAVDHGSTPQFY
ncbi:hypothetical protein TWF730_009069 [Orbilia blumenaviensis]|uniref:C2H2-type domain-containing protein n=1 Tax=Orbilia blumenaviensis TaxID=1796055 RepID=A0AAV9V0H9_9PEZI